jgi:hypothetical protein
LNISNYYDQDDLPVKAFGNALRINVSLQSLTLSVSLDAIYGFGDIGAIALAQGLR